MRIEEMCREDAESAIIATLIHHPEFFYNAENLLPLHFSKRDNQFLYTAITNLIKRDVPNIDALNILESLASEPATCAFSREITVDRVQELIDMSVNIARPTLKEYVMYANVVIDAAFRRDMYQKLEECKRMCLDMREANLQQKISDAVDGLMVAYSTTNDIQPFSEVVDDCWADIQSRYGTGYAGLPFRFNTLNEYVTMEKGELVVFGGSAKQGKSMMLLNHAMDLLKADKSVLYLDSELNDVLFTKRILAHLTGIEYRRINDGTFSPEEGEKIQQAIEWIKQRQFTHLYIPMFDLQSIYTAVKKVYHRQGGLDVLVVDQEWFTLNLSNCWNTLRAHTPQRSDEISASATAREVCGLGNQQPRPEQGKVQRLSRRRVGRKRARSGRHRILRRRYSLSVRGNTEE